MTKMDDSKESLTQKGELAAPPIHMSFLRYFEHVSIKDGPRLHDWSLYLRSVTRVCMGGRTQWSLLKTHLQYYMH